MNPSVFIIGCGYVGSRVAQACTERGAKIGALVRSQKTADSLKAQGLSITVGDLDDIWTIRRLKLAGQLVFYFAPPPDAGVNDTRLRSLAAVLSTGEAPAHIVLISTTAVYGDCAGAWVTEQTPVNPATDRARRRLDAETVLRSWGRAHQVPVSVLRVAGIYGPGRLPDERLRRGTPMVAETECPYSNRIHVTDLVAACIAAAEKPAADSIYNISDGAPGTMAEYFNRVADLLGLPRPPVISLQEARSRLSPGMLSYLSESRRIDNKKMLTELGVTLRYPNLDSGLQASLAADE